MYLIGLENHYIVQASAGGTHSAVLTDTGRILIWGRGSFGRLGDGLGKNKLTPCEVVLPGGANRWHVIAVACGGRHTSCLAYPLIPDSYKRQLSIDEKELSEEIDQEFARTQDQVSGRKACFDTSMSSANRKEQDMDEIFPLSGEQEVEDRTDVIVEMVHSDVEVYSSALQNVLPDSGDCITPEQHLMSKDNPEGVRTCEY